LIKSFLHLSAIVLVQAQAWQYPPGLLAHPMQAAVGRTPRRRFKARRIENGRIRRINRDIVNVTIFVEYLLPARAAIFRKKYASTVSVPTCRSGPCGEVKTIWRIGIHSESVRPVRSLRQCDCLPMLSAVSRLIQSAIAGITNAAIF